MIVDDYPVVDQQLRGNGADAGRGWHRQAGGHIRYCAGRRSAQPDRVPGRVRGLRWRGGTCAHRRAHRRSHGRVCWRSSRPACGAWPGRHGALPIRPACVVCRGRLGRPGRRLPVGGTRRRGRHSRGRAARLTRGRVSSLAGGLGRRRLGQRVVIGEEAPPGLVHRAGVRLVPLIKLVNKPLIRPEIRLRACPVMRRTVMRLLAGGLGRTG